MFWKYDLPGPQCLPKHLQHVISKLKIHLLIKRPNLFHMPTLESKYRSIIFDISLLDYSMGRWMFFRRKC